MKECDVCGNEIPACSALCPFCEARQPELLSIIPNERRHRIITVNLEEGMPSVEKALVRLDAALRCADASESAIIRVIHGYGSSGVGGSLRQAVRSQLDALSRRGRIRSFVPGELCGPRSAEIRRLAKRYPRLALSNRSDTGNPGITLIEL